ncbi:MAG: hypothetical protein JOZ19_11615, partial [Rubrobacter sp.]|nr:hypothetical protein [Rubrobacter sp.]
MQKHPLPYLPVLPLGVDALGVVHPTVGQVLKPFVAVEASAVLPYLRQLRPYLVYEGMHGYSPRGLDRKVGYQLVAWQRFAYLLNRGALFEVPSADGDGVHPGEYCPEDRQWAKQVHRSLPWPHDSPG